MIISTYKLKLIDKQVINMKNGAQCLSVYMKKNSVIMSVLEDETVKSIAHKIAIYKHDDPIKENTGKFIATFTTPDGYLVWHIFDQGTTDI